MSLEPAAYTSADANRQGTSTVWSRYVRRPTLSARLAGRVAKDLEEKVVTVLEPQRGVKYAERLAVLVDWEGVVEEVNDDEFTARLLNRRSGSKVDTEFAEIPFTEVQLDDLSLVEPGAIFYLTVYRVTTSSGQSRRATSLYFRRVPSWTRSMLASAEERANRWKKHFGVGKNIVTSN